MGIFFWLARPQQGLWHKLIEGHLVFPLPTPGSLFFRTPLVFGLLLGCHLRFQIGSWLTDPPKSKLFCLWGLLGILVYLCLPFPYEASSFSEYQHYASAVYGALSFSLWAFLCAFTIKPLEFLWKHKKLVALSLLVTLGFHFLAREAYSNPGLPILGPVMDLYRYGLMDGSFHLLKPFFQNITLDRHTNMVLVDDFRVWIHFECSGFQGLQLLTLFSACFILFEKPFIKNVWKWLLVGVILILILNLFRVATLIAIGASGHPDWAINAFHSSAGSLYFVMVSVLMIYFAHRNNASYQSKSKPNPLGVLEKSDLLPFLGFIFLTLLFRPLTPEYDWSYPIKVVCLGLLLLKNTVWETLVTVEKPPLMAFMTGGLVALIWVIFQPLSTPSPAPSDVGWLWVATRLIGAIVLIPIIEERFFRRYLIHFITFRKGRHGLPAPYELIPCLISSFAFGYVHQNFWGGFISGLIFCWMASNRKRLSDAIWAHVIANLILALLVLGHGQWQYW